MTRAPAKYQTVRKNHELHPWLLHFGVQRYNKLFEFASQSANFMLFYIKICKYVYFFVSLQMFSAYCARRQVNKRIF